MSPIDTYSKLASCHIQAMAWSVRSTSRNMATNQKRQKKTYAYA